MTTYRVNFLKHNFEIWNGESTDFMYMNKRLVHFVWLDGMVWLDNYGMVWYHGMVPHIRRILP